MLAKQEIVSILVTFAVGFMAGGYLYLTQFSKLVSPDDVATIEEVQVFSIVSEAYGGCRQNCPSFQVKNDGTYRYSYVPALGADRTFLEGTLPRNLQRELGSAITSRALAPQTNLTNPDNCLSFTDGNDIRYTVTLEGRDYELDSCGTSVDFNSTAWITLAKLWNYFQTIQ